MTNQHSQDQNQSTNSIQDQLGSTPYNSDDHFMNTEQLEYFRQKLLDWSNQIIEEANQTLQQLQTDKAPEADLLDHATNELDQSLELRARERSRKLLSKIQEALERINDGSYGYCEETGEPINIKRLEARPIATLSIEAQERHERRERNHRE